MGKKTVLFKSEEKMSKGEAAQLLRVFADKLDKGRVVLSQEGKEAVLKTPGRGEVEIKAEKEVGKNRTTKKLEVEIEWRVGGKQQSGPLNVK